MGRRARRRLALAALVLVAAACTQPTKPQGGNAPPTTSGSGPATTAPGTSPTTPPGPATGPFRITPRAGIWGAADGEALAAVVIGDVLYIGGSFTAITSPDGSEHRPAAHLAAISLSTGRPIDAFTAGANAEVRALATDGTRLFVGGKYTAINGLPRPWLNALDPATGAVLPGWNAELNGTVRALTIANGSLYAGGWFRSSGSVHVPRAAKLSLATGAVDARFHPAPDAAIFSLAPTPDGRHIYMGGDFTTVDGQPRRWIAGVDAFTGAATPPPLVGPTGWANAIAVTPDGTRVVGGLKGHHTINQAMAWDVATGAKAWELKIGGDGAAVHLVSGTAYVGFHDNFELNTNIKLIGIDVATGAVDRDFMPAINSFKGVKAITSTGAHGLIATGAFTVTEGISTPRVAVFPER